MSVVIFCSQLAGLCSGCSGAHWAGASSGYTDDWAAAAWALDAAHCDDTTDNNIILIVFASSPEILFIDSPFCDLLSLLPE